jgi:site-specific recombinase XerD
LRRWTFRKKVAAEHAEVADFMAYLQLKNLSARTLVEYEKVLRSLFSYVGLGGSSPARITAAQLRDYLSSLQQNGLSPKTVSDRVVVIKRFFGFLLAEGCLEDDPSRRLPRPRVGQRLPKALTGEQIQILFAAMNGDLLHGRRDRMLFWLIYACGLRVDEAVHIKARDVNLTDGTLRVIGKGDKERQVYLKPAVVEALKDYIGQQDGEAYLFPGRFGGSLTSRNVQLRLKEYVRQAGLPDEVSPHTLRHSVAVHYLMGGAPVSFVQELLGHESLATTGIYTRLADPQAKEITLKTRTALDDLYEEEGSEERELRDTLQAYQVELSEFEAWDEFVSLVLEWL